MNETRYPLCWPGNWKRTTSRASAQFGKNERRADGFLDKKRLSLQDSIQRIADELRRFGVKEESVIISTNLPLNIYGAPRGDRGEPSDPGCAVYWQQKGKPQCMAIDRYSRVADNLAAIAATLEALRAIERHGGGSILERAFIGFAALPAATARPWRIVLGFAEGIHLTEDMVNQAFRSRASSLHPDKGGEHELMAELNGARAAAIKELHG